MPTTSLSTVPDGGWIGDVEEVTLYYDASERTLYYVETFRQYDEVDGQRVGDGSPHFFIAALTPGI